MSSIDVLLHWAVLDIQQWLTDTGWKIVVTTNNPCHLWIRYSYTIPQKHILLELERGAYIERRAKYCFVAYYNLEQEETDDTLEHTFWLEPWPVCQTRWFYFFGTVGGVDSPSESPIFEKHRSEDFGWMMRELWHFDYEPPPMRKWVHERWTYYIVVPEMELLLTELWS